MNDLLFVGGDLSGIQKFIYNISSKKAMVSLKGRSAYLREYMDSVCDEILNSESIKTSTNTDKVYSSGGKFYAIVENTPSNIEHIKRVIKEEQQYLWNEHKGQLALNICYTPFSFNKDKTKVYVDGESNNNLGILWKKLTEQFNDLKYQKFKDVLLVNYDDFFEVTEVGETPDVCAVTGIEGKCVSIDKDENGDTIRVLPSVKEQIIKGQKIRDKEHFKMLEEYAQDSYLGVLRMDVDKLGSLFANGFETLDKYKKISQTLDSFFSDVNGKESKLHEIQKKDEYRDDMNIVYAGGDDIFAVGRWDKVIDFAKEVRDEFVKHINNKDVTISGGIAIVSAKYPIAKSAELSGEAEDAAKKYKNGVKNAFCMFGETVSWDKEFDYVLSYKKQFVDLIDKHDLSRGILHKIMKYADIVKTNSIIDKEKEMNVNTPNYVPKQKDYSYLWHASYYLTRYIKDNNDKSDIVNKFCKDLRDKQLQNAENYRLMSIAARWAELELREKNNKKRIIL